MLPHKSLTYLSFVQIVNLLLMEKGELPEPGSKSHIVTRANSSDAGKTLLVIITLLPPKIQESEHCFVFMSKISPKQML